ncbi:RIP metalloprotease RseP [Candidatus Pseudomonas adelgestsugas]|uniref:Zinc metalloprotease n=1 Tax=Candidatus Pseudomonas adelgestsugas TaxID=1302376 RepID=A0ABX5R9Z0_9PSED|nr:RIP metalloprotease RseP [Candidatus Pseudomonas adelgestsugas]QAX82083.1 Regulator of sigma-E protease RseP [Candidatus Pseudomonas adelgestsugas]
MSVLYMIVGTIVALGVLITFHEFGHFWMSRRCGVKVLRFSVGFGMPLLRWHDRRGTEFVVSAIPLGGYVKMLDGRDGEVPADQLEQSFNRKTVLQHVAIVIAGPIANFLLAMVLFWVLAVIGSQQIRPIIGAVEVDSIAAKAGLVAGQEIVSIDGEKTSSWSAVNLQLVRRFGESGTMYMVVRNYDSTIETLREVFLDHWLKSVDEPDPIKSLGVRPWRPDLLPVLAWLDQKGPAQAAGLKAGDRLLAFDGQSLSDWQQVVDLVRVLPGTRIVLKVERDGNQLNVPVTLLAHKEAQSSWVGYLGAGVKGVEWPHSMVREVRVGPLVAISESVKRTWIISVLTSESLKKMLFGELSVKNLSGPITIAKVAGNSAQSSIADFLNFLAYLSISLGILNLLPIPILDGGYLLFYLIEWVRGRPLSDRIQSWWVQIGMCLMVGVMLLALINDLERL